MRDRLDEAKSTLERVGALFLLLWFISAVTDILGNYEYEVEFLQLAVGFFLLSSVPTAFRPGYSPGKKVQKLFTNVGWPLVGFWILFKVMRWIGWFGAMDIEVNIDYLLVTGIILLLMGYAAKSLRLKTGYWAARSVLFTVGGVSVFFWILIKVFKIFPEYAEYTLVLGILCIGVAFILGGLKKPPSFLVEIEEREPEITEEISVANEDVSINRDHARIKINKGSLIVPITRGKEVGAVYFGEGSYMVDARVKVYQDLYRGITVVSGTEWDAVRDLQKWRLADEKAFEDIGVKREDILELARRQVEEKFTDELRRKLKDVQISLPFFKVKETPQGSYVKVGPIEVTETPGGDRVHIGPLELDSGSRFQRRGLLIQIHSREEDITVKTNGATVFTKGDTKVTVNDGVTLQDNDVHLVMDEDKKVLRSGRMRLICREDKRILHSPGFELSVTETSGRIRKNGKLTVITDENTLRTIRAEIDAVADELIRKVLDREELRELDALIKKFEQELS